MRHPKSIFILVHLRRSIVFTRTRRARAFQPSLGLAALEDRYLLAGNVLQTNLVSDLPGVAQVLDPHLVNPWGIAENSASPFWVADNNAGVSTLYNLPGANPKPTA